MEKEKLSIKFGGYQGPNSIHTQAARCFGSELQKNIGHEILFELEESVLDRGLKSGDLPKMVASGDLDLCYISTVRCSESVPELAIFELPFLFKNRAGIFSELDGNLGIHFKDQLEKLTPFTPLGFWDNGYRHISNSVHPIRTPEDCRNLTIRTQMSKLHTEVFQLFGFNPVAADIKDFLDNIETDLFHAQDNPLTSILIFDIHRHHRFITLSAHLFGVTLLLCNKKAFENWPEKVQYIVIEAAEQATILQRKLAVEQDKKALSALRSEGCEIHELSSSERIMFEQAVLSLTDLYKKKLGSRLFELLQV